MTDEDQRKECRAEGEALRDLMRHPGWAFLMKRIDAQAQSYLSGLRNASSDFEVSRLHAKYVAFTDLQEFAKSTARTLLTVAAQ